MGLDHLFLRALFSTKSHAFCKGSFSYKKLLIGTEAYSGSTLSKASLEKGTPESGIDGLPVKQSQLIASALSD